MGKSEIHRQASMKNNSGNSVLKRMFLLLMLSAISHGAHSQSTSRISVVRPASPVRPLDWVTVLSKAGGTLIVNDGRGRPYVRMPSAPEVTIRAGGAAGTHTVTLLGRDGDTSGRASFRMEAGTDIQDSGRINELFRMLWKGMNADAPGGVQEITWNGTA